MRVLLADPNESFVDGIYQEWNLEGSTLKTASSNTELMAESKKDQFDTIFISSDFLIINELDFISFIKEHSPKIEIVVLCDSKSVQIAENALSKGASSYLLKPLNINVLHEATRKISFRIRDQINHRTLEEHVLKDLLGDTPEMRKIRKLIYKIGPTNSTILITGESGTGKEFVANIIHRLSKRTDDPFIAVNCGAIPENLVESELFGTKKGAYTGATSDKRGLFEDADLGTLFLDEIGDLPAATQVKLLRFLQDKEFRRVGDNESRHVDVRIIAATNKSLVAEISKGHFREDLFYRLNVFHIHLPPLRDRKETIPHLVKFFVLKYNNETNKNVTNIDKAAQIALSSYDYPGNIRELENIIEHGVVLAEDGVIKLEDLPPQLHETPDYLQLPKSTGSNTIDEITRESKELLSLADVEKAHIIRALTILKNNQTEVAKKLGISRSTLWRKLQDHEIKLDK
ncbi:MAG: sigma-54 dependent transcriptional regulator [Fibrobacterales bacterium]